MELDFILEESGRLFRDKYIMLVPCLYIVLWFLKKTPVFRSASLIIDYAVILLGAAACALLNGFDFYNILIGLFCGGTAVIIYSRNGGKEKCKCMECKKKKKQKKK